VSRVGPRCSSAFPADRHGLRPETISRSACLRRVAAALRLQAKRSFFKCLLRGEVALGIVRSRLHARQSHPVQQLADGALVHLHVEAFGDLIAQIDTAPAHDAMACRIRPGQNDVLQFGHLLIRQGRRPPAARRISEPCDPIGIVTMHPVPQRLTVHAAATRRIRPRHPVQHVGNRQNPTCNPSVVASRRFPPQRRRRAVSPRHLNRMSHGNPRANQTSHTVNQSSQENPSQESRLQAIGIRAQPVHPGVH